MALRVFNLGGSPVSVSRGGNPIVTFQDEVNKLFSDFFGEMPLSALSRTQQSVAHGPAVDLSETDKEYLVTAELPGLDVADVQITVTDGYVTIRGEKKAVQAEEKEGYFRRERAYGAFQRVISLPDTANLDNVEAKMDKGVLILSILKQASAHSKERKIEIKSAA